MEILSKKLEERSTLTQETHSLRDGEIDSLTVLCGKPHYVSWAVTDRSQSQAGPKLIQKSHLPTECWHKHSPALNFLIIVIHCVFESMNTMMCVEAGDQLRAVNSLL